MLRHAVWVLRAHRSFLAANKPGFKHLEFSHLQSHCVAQRDFTARINNEEMAL